MALMSPEDNNENTHTTKTTTRSKYKYQEKKKQKIKIKLKVSTSVASPVSYERNDIYNLPMQISVPNNIPTMLSSYPIYTNYMYPALVDWAPVIPVQNPVYRIHLPVVVNPVQIVTTQVCTQVSPYIGIVPPTISSPLLTPVNEIVHSDLESVVCYDSELHKEEKRLESYYPIQNEENYLNFHNDVIAETDDFISYSNEINKQVHEVQQINDLVNRKQNKEVGDPLEFYLTLPKELFPAARTLTVDPNPIIDEFCKIPNIHKHAPWILDLEFGVPNLPITRPIPSYNVKLNSVNCKNAPDAIHPGFESCDKDFKEVFLFYYDCVISTWYRGYIMLNNDRSVENFQSWLLLPAQVLGMCWS